MATPRPAPNAKSRSALLVERQAGEARDDGEATTKVKDQPPLFPAGDIRRIGVPLLDKASPCPNNSPYRLSTNKNDNKSATYYLHNTASPCHTSPTIYFGYSTYHCMGDHEFGVIIMTTGAFIIARWVLTFGIPLAIAVHQLVLLRRAQEADQAAAVPAE